MTKHIFLESLLYEHMYLCISLKLCVQEKHFLRFGTFGVARLENEDLSQCHPGGERTEILIWRDHIFKHGQYLATEVTKCWNLVTFWLAYLEFTTYLLVFSWGKSASLGDKIKLLWHNNSVLSGYSGLGEDVQFVLPQRPCRLLRCPRSSFNWRFEQEIPNWKILEISGGEKPPKW